MPTTPGEFFGIWVAAGLTLMMFSFIYKDNRFFKFGEHLYLGISIGYFINVQYWSVIIPDVYRAMVIEHNYYVLIPALLGVFILLRLVPSLGWLSRMSFALYIGGAAGIAIPIVINGVLLPQLTQTLRPFDFAGGPGAVGSNINLLITLVGVFTTLIFFFFSVEHKKAVGAISRIGLLFIMISFGASFGYTVMARISLLIGRFQFLLDEWFFGTIMRRG